MALSSSIQIEPLKRTETADIVKIAGVLILLLAGALYLVTGVASLSDADHRESAYRIAALWAMAYCAGGFLVGFLFGIPRVLQANDTKSADKEKSARPGYAQRVNTNLEQISDWLTKIIVGLGLVQLRKIPQNLYDAATWMARSFTPPDGNIAQAASFSTSIIILFSVTGFVGGYLVTRLFIAGAFRRADTETTETVTGSGISDDQAKQKLMKFWKPDGKTNPEHEKLLVEWMTKHGLITQDKTISIGLFINARDYAQQRAQAVQDLPVE
jgi:hypothetical protein